MGDIPFFLLHKPRVRSGPQASILGNPLYPQGTTAPATAPRNALRSIAGPITLVAVAQVAGGSVVTQGTGGVTIGASAVHFKIIFGPHAMRLTAL